MLFLVGLSFIIRNFWCRYLCPYGALLGLLALASPFQVKRDKETCIDCKKCEKTCPASITLTTKKPITYRGMHRLHGVCLRLPC